MSEEEEEVEEEEEDSSTMKCVMTRVNGIEEDVPRPRRRVVRGLGDGAADGYVPLSHEGETVTDDQSRRLVDARFALAPPELRRRRCS